MSEVKRGKPTKPKTAETQESERSELVEVVKEDIKRKPTKYRTEEGLRKQSYRRFKEGVDYMPIEANEMEAIIGLIKNSFKSSNVGRPPKYAEPEEFIGAVEAFWDYLNEVNKEQTMIIPDVEGLACYLGLSRETLMEWERTRSAEFSATIKSAKNAMAFCKKQLALRGKIPPIVFATDFNNNHGYTQKQEIEVRASNPLGDTPDQKALAERAAQDMGIDFVEVDGE